MSKTGLDVWLDKERLLPGQDWDREIRTALRASRFFVLLISEHSVDKQGYVQKEVRLALDLFNEFPPGEVFAIPVRLDDSKPRHDELLRLQWCDLFRSWEMSVNG